MSSRASRTLYVGNLPGDIRLREVEDLFIKYGPIVDIDLKVPPRPPGYAFVEFEDPRDADDAIYGRDGYKFDGYRLRVELAHGSRGYSSSADRYSSYSSSSRAVARHSDYRVLVTGLPSSASWQDLKDHMRRAGDVCFSQVFRDRRGMTGIVDYTNYDDMKYAIRKLDDTEFRNAFSRSYIRSMIQGEAAPGVPFMTREGAILEVLVIVHIAKAPFTATAIVAGAEACHRGGNIHIVLHHYLVQDLALAEIWGHNGRNLMGFWWSRSRSQSPISYPPRRQLNRSRLRSRSASVSRSPSVRSERSRSIDSQDRY
ncbi:hypothetical protein TIFTF001_013118 [Ficus carica]|uniref:RRM domain-containing protein n=1 Tax=Ficus carica TaxID=3494 RepID=A0AA88A2X9_FICCA|nr:hypothetical protein TIFTF001_013118 [Ficus carica]